ncbi:MAG: hypothetical protein HQ581_09905 [Planctomycetes bacterium]|nr:hypothetical protein [Planctomycetota bacterium]
MPCIYLQIPPTNYQTLLTHLLPDGSKFEEAAFLFVKPSERQEPSVFEYIDHCEVPPDGFSSRHSDYLELTDEFRASLIKRAHDLGASIAEFHSHPSPWPAAFSYSDRLGFNEFVPHVRWRLKGRPYFAVVVSATGFDALAWINGHEAPVPLDGLFVGTEILSATMLTIPQWKESDERNTLRPKRPFLW